MSTTEQELKPSVTPSAERDGAGASENGNGDREKRSRAPVLLVVVIAAIVSIVLLYKHWLFSSTHEGTDNAFLTSDVIQIAPQVTGTVSRILVDDNQLVKKGQLLVVLDDSTYRAGLQQAEANLDAAIAEARGAGISVGLTAQTGSGQLQQAQGMVAQAESALAGAGSDVRKNAAAVSTAQANARSAQAAIGTARANYNAALAAKKRYGQVLKAAEASLDAAQAQAARADRDAKRYASLVAQGAVSEQTADQYASTAKSLNAQAEASKADVAAAQEQLGLADATIAQTKAQLSASQDQAAAAQAGVRQAKAEMQASEQAVSEAAARRSQASGQLTQAKTAPRQVALSRSAHQQASAKIEQAQAALEQARIALEDTRIYAPSAGRVSKKTVELGSLVQAGTPLMAVIPQDDIWVTANYKETQVAGMRPGAEARVEVDAFPGRSFHGRVDSVSAATGATFALLPPDNATGNFTKVVQRIPVKIVLDRNQPDIERLRAGMSVTAIVRTR